jgi:hypothetical protein
VDHVIFEPEILNDLKKAGYPPKAVGLILNYASHLCIESTEKSPESDRTLTVEELRPSYEIKAEHLDQAKQRWDCFLQKVD